MKVGRNDPCPCGSGRKYKKCCGNPAAEDVKPLPIPLEVLRELQRHQMQEVKRQQAFGLVRPDIGIRFKDHEIVAVGNKLCISKKWRLATDFLMDYVPLVFEKDWFREGYKKPLEENHPIIQMHRKTNDLLRKKAKEQQVGDEFEFAMTGYALGYFSFAFDLYTAAHNSGLDSGLLERLKQPHGYQGARHELFAEATCLRAGYEIFHEDETDGSKRHAEFVAKHKETGQRIAVEAKSRHRETPLNYAEALDSEEMLRIRFGKLINDAIAKNPSDPLVIFVDTNLSPATARNFYPQDTSKPFLPPRVISKILNQAKEKNGGKDPFNLIVFTNYLTQYGQGDEPHPPKSILAIQTTVPTLVPQYPRALFQLYDAAQLHGNIPKHLPSHGNR